MARGRAWTDEDMSAIRKMALDGSNVTDIARVVNRSENATRVKACRMGIAIGSSERRPFVLTSSQIKTVRHARWKGMPWREIADIVGVNEWRVRYAYKRQTGSLA